jgi:hypothetical protein
LHVSFVCVLTKSTELPYSGALDASIAEVDCECNLPAEVDCPETSWCFPPPLTVSFTTCAGPKYREPKMASHDLRAGSFKDGYLCNIITWASSTTNMDALPPSPLPLSLPYCVSRPHIFSHSGRPLSWVHQRIIFHLHASGSTSRSFRRSVLSLLALVLTSAAASLSL